MDNLTKKPFEICFKILNFYGLSIKDDETKRHKIFGILRIIFFPFLLIILLVEGIYQRNKSGFTHELAEPLSLIIGGFNMMIRIVVFYKEVDKLKSLYNLTEKLAKDCVENQLLLHKRLNIAMKILIVALIMSIISILSGSIVSFQTRKLSYPIAVPFNIHKSETGFWMVWFYLTVAFCHVGPFYPALGLLPIFFMSFAIGLMKDFNGRLKNVGKVTESQIDQELQKLIEIHEEIKNYLHKVSDLFKYTFFLKGICVSMILCLAIFAIPLVR